MGRFNWGLGSSRFGKWGVGQLADDNPPPIDSMPGSATSDSGNYAGVDTGGDSNPAVNPYFNPNAASDAGAQSTTPAGVNQTNPPAPPAPAPAPAPAPQPQPQPNIAPHQTVVVNPAPSPNWTAWLVTGAVAVGGGAVAYTYWKKHHRRH